MSLIFDDLIFGRISKNQLQPVSCFTKSLLRELVERAKYHPLDQIHRIWSSGWYFALQTKLLETIRVSTIIFTFNSRHRKNKLTF
jgi:hypothetical protein